MTNNYIQTIAAAAVLAIGAAGGVTKAAAELQNVRVAQSQNSGAVVARVNLEKAAEAIKLSSAFKFGDGREALAAVEEIVRQSQYNADDRRAVAGMLGDLLGGSGTTDGKAFACRQLWIIGTPAEVPALAAALKDPKLSDIARYALQNLDDPSVDAALIEALKDTAPSIQIGVINSLAMRKPPGVLDAIKPLRKSKDKAVAAAAKHAIGRIEGKIVP